MEVTEHTAHARAAHSAWQKRVLQGQEHRRWLASAVLKRCLMLFQVHTFLRYISVGSVAPVCGTVRETILGTICQTLASKRHSRMSWD
eukprot:2667129-Rhodomonas_salina.1